MAEINENINFNVNFNEDSIDESASSLDRIDALMEKIEKSADNLRAKKFINVKDIKDSEAAMDALRKHVELVKSTISEMQKSSSANLFEPDIENLTVGLENIRNIMRKIVDANKVDITPKNTISQQTEGYQRAVAMASVLSAEARKRVDIEAKELQQLKGISKEEAYIKAVSAEYTRERQRALNAERQNREETERAAEAEKRLKEQALETQNALKGQIGSLGSEVSELEKTYKNIFSTGNWNGLNEANKKLTELKAKADELKQKLAEDKAQGIDTSGLESSLDGVESQMSGLADTASKGIKKKLTSSFKSVFQSASNIADKAFNTMYRTAVTLTKRWANLLQRVFSSVMSGWKKALSWVFQTGNKGSSLLAGQLGTLLGAASLAGLIALGKQAVSLSSDLVKAQNVIDNVFTDSTDTIDDFCQSAINKFGLVELEAKNMIGTFGGLLGAANVTGRAQTEMSKNLTALAGDLASFNNMSSEAVFKKLQSGLTGSATALRSLGINMTTANLEAFRLSRGIKTAYSEMSQAEKITLRYNYILSQTASAQGDYAKNFGTWANQVRLLTNNFKQLLAILGGGIIKALYPAVVVLNQIVAAAVNAANALAKIFGFQAIDLSNMFGGGGEIPDLDSYTEDLSNVADATNDVADATERANDNLQTFDKLNNIKSPTATPTADVSMLSAGGVGGLFDFDSYYESIGEPEVVIGKKLQKIIDVIKDFAKDIASVNYDDFIKSWKGVSERLGVLAGDAGNGIIWLWKKVLFPFYKWGMEQGSPAVLDLLAAGLEALHEIIVAVAPEIDEFWDSKLAPFFSSKGEAFVELMKRWTNSLKLWTDGLRNSGDKIGYLETTVKELKKKLYNWIDDEGITSRLDSIGQHFKNIFKKLISPEAGEQAKKLLTTFTKLNLIVFDNILKVIEYLTGNQKVTDFVGFIVDEFGELADFTFDALIDVIDYIAGSDDARQIIDNIKIAIENIIQWIVDNKEGILTFLKGASELVVWLSEHVELLIGLLITIKTIKAFATIGAGIQGVIGTVKLLKAALGIIPTTLSGIGSVASGVFGSLTSGFGSFVTALSTFNPWAIPVLGIAGVVAGLTALGKAAYDYTQDIIKAQDEFDAALTKSQSVIDNLANSDSHLLEGKENAYDYAYALMDATDAFNGLSEKTKTAVASKGKNVLFSREDNKQLKKDAQTYVDALKEAGYANDELIEKIEKLANTKVGGIGGMGVTEWRTELLTAMREATMDIETEVASLRDSTDEEMNQINANMNKKGGEAMQSYANGIADNTVLVDAATGQLYNRLTGVYEEITDASQTAGLDTIVGYVDGMNEGDDILITATGQFIDKSTGAILSKVPEEWRQTAISAIDGMALEFNEDGSVKIAAEKLITDATNAADKKAKSDSKDVGEDMVDGIEKGIESNKNGVVNTTNGVINEAISTSAKNANNQSQDIGVQMIAGMETGVERKKSSILSKVGNICNTILNKFRNAMKIHSPSQAFADLAEFIPLGIAKGIEDTSEEAYGSVTELSRKMLDGLDAESFDLSSIVDASKFSDKYKDILYQTDAFNKEMKSKYGDMTPLEMQSSMITSPKVKRAELAANTDQSISTRMAEGMSALFSRIGGVSGSNGNNGNIVCNLIMSGDKMASFVIDTVKGEAIQTGNF